MKAHPSEEFHLKRHNKQFCPPKWSPLNAQGKKTGGENEKESQDCCATFKPKNYLEILFSAHLWTLQAIILHVDQKVAKYTTCKGLCGKL